jgi:multiple sugar transport system substrate-binding protein
MDATARLTRRHFLRLATSVAAGAVAVACAPATPVVVEREVVREVPVEKAVIVEKEVPKEIIKEVPVEKEVVKEVEKIVRETVVVEKEVAAQPAEKAEIEWWHGWGGMTGVNAMQAVADAFNTQSQTIYVHRLQVSEISDKYMTAIAGGAPPDVEIGNLPYAQFWAREVVMVLDDWVNSSQVIDVADTMPEAIEGGKWKGKTYGWPTVESSIRFAFSYNADLVADAGLDPDNPPLTWDETYEWHEKITKFDSAGNLEILGFDPMDAMGGSGPGPPDPFFWPPDYGLKWWDKDKLTFHFDDPLFIEALTTIRRFYDLVGVEKMAGYRSSYGTWTQSPTASFPAGVQAMIVNGPWQPGELFHSAPGKDFRYTWPPTPSDRRGTKFQASGGHYGSIPNGAKHPEAAFEFIEFTTMDTAANIVFDQTGWLCPRISWNAKLDVSRYEGLEFYTKSIEEADEMWPSAGCPISGFVGQNWRNTVDSVNYGEKIPEEAAKDLQELCTGELRKQFPELAP